MRASAVSTGADTGDGGYIALKGCAMPFAKMPRKWILLLLVLLLLGAMGVRLLTYDRYLPFTDYTDENVWFLVGQNWRGVTQDEFIAWRYAGMPPVYGVVNMTVQTFVDWAVPTDWSTLAQHFVVLRLLAVLVGVATTALIFSIGCQLAGPLAGLLGGLIWGFSPVIVDHNSLALPDPFVYLFAASALALGLHGWKRESFGWLAVSFVAGLLTVYTKGWPAHAMIPWGFAVLLLAFKQPRRYVPWLAAGVVLFGLAMYWLAIVHGAFSNPSREMQTINNDAVQFMLTPARHIQNWRFAIYPIGLVSFFGIIVVGAGAAIWSRWQRQWTLDWSRIAMLALFSFAGIMLASSFTVSRLEAGKIRHVLPVTVALIPLWAAFLTQIVSAVGQVAGARGISQSRQRVLMAALPGVLVVAFLAPAAIEIGGLVQQYSRTAMLQIVWEWSDANVPNDGLILTHPGGSLERTWNRGWSGYDGHTPFEWWFEEDPTAYTPAEYLDRGIMYVAVDERDITQRFAAVEGLEAYLADLTLVKTLPADETIMGQTTYFYRIAPPQQVVNVPYGETIELVGYDISAQRVVPGASLTLRPYWQTLRQPAANYSMFIHMYPASEVRVITQYDGAPASPRRPTMTWNDPAELYIGPDAGLTIPEDTPPGAYVLAVGLYDYTTGVRLLLADGADWYGIPLQVE
jgi:4-amino-4-deoxy-L-arabinose transferase-like glycosyltransferase